MFIIFQSRWGNPSFWEDPGSSCFRWQGTLGTWWCLQHHMWHRHHLLPIWYSGMSHRDWGMGIHEYQNEPDQCTWRHHYRWIPGTNDSTNGVGVSGYICSKQITFHILNIFFLVKWWMGCHRYDCKVEAGDAWWNQLLKSSVHHLYESSVSSNFNVESNQALFCLIIIKMRN